MSKKAHRKHAPARAPRKKRAPLVAIAAAVLGVAGAAYFYLTPEATPNYAPEDVVYDRPIRAVHEMQAGPPIRFLPGDQRQPKIVLPDNTHDFGSIGAKAVVKRQFVIRNAGEAPLTISRAYTTCGCTTADLTARVIPPGKVILATLTFDAGFHDARGKTVRRGLIIENNDPSQPEAAIWVQASVGYR